MWSSGEEAERGAAPCGRFVSVSAVLIAGFGDLGRSAGYLLNLARQQKGLQMVIGEGTSASRPCLRYAAQIELRSRPQNSGSEEHTGHL